MRAFRGWVSFTTVAKHAAETERIKKIFRDWHEYARQRHDLLKYLHEGKMNVEAYGLVTPSKIGDALSDTN